jgi:hypothetical protein
MKNKLCIAIKEIGNWGKDRGTADKIIMLIVLCIIKVIGLMIYGKVMESLLCLMEVMMGYGMKGK